MKYILNGFVSYWDSEPQRIGVYNTLEDAQRGAREYMRDNSYNGFEELEILPIGSYSYWTVKYIYDMYNGWEQY